MIFSRTVVTAEEIMATLPFDEDSLYTTRGALKQPRSDAERCYAGAGTPDHCPKVGDCGGLCAGHIRRRKNPPQDKTWDSPLYPTRGRPRKPRT